MADVGAAARGGSRASRIRKMIEKDGRIDDKLFAKEAVSYRPWDVVAKALSDSKQGPALAKETEGFDFTRMFTDAKVTVEDAAEYGTEVRIRWRFRGVHSGTFLGVKPTNAKVDFTGYTSYRFEGDQIVEVWGAADCASLGTMCSEIVNVMTTIREQPQAVCFVAPDQRIEKAKA